MSEVEGVFFCRCCVVSLRWFLFGIQTRNQFKLKYCDFSITKKNIDVITLPLVVEVSRIPKHIESLPQVYAVTRRAQMRAPTLSRRSPNKTFALVVATCV